MNDQGINQAVIFAGGLGTRLRPYTDENPKAMYPINGKPFLAYLIEQIQEFGIEKILILLGYMSDKIVNYFGDGSKYNVAISYDITPVDFQTGDRLIYAKDKLEQCFLLMYCDNYCPIDYFRLKEEFYNNDAWIQVSAYENMDNYTKSNLSIGENGRVIIYDKKRITLNLQGVDIGYAVIRKSMLDMIFLEGQNFENVAYNYAVAQNKMYATLTKHRYYSVGSWDRIELTTSFFNNNKIVFLDRDGTINKKASRACYIEEPDQFVWLDGAKEAIRLLNMNDYKVILITNQPGIARGKLSEGTLQAIHEKMKRELLEIGAHVDKIYYCPHDWDGGCECRKPKPGMLYQAQKEYNLNLTKCILIGDDDRDIEAGNKARCRTYKITEERNLLQIVKDMVEEK